jgi:hypothetical protein
MFDFYLSDACISDSRECIFCIGDYQLKCKALGMFSSNATDQTVAVHWQGFWLNIAADEASFHNTISAPMDMNNYVPWITVHLQG